MNKQTKFKQTEIGMIPEDWEVKLIHEVAEVVGGGTPSTKNPEFWDGDIAWITPKDLSNFKFRYIRGGERSITKKGLENSSAKLLPKDTVLLTTRAPVGYLAIAEEELSTNQGLRSLIPKGNVKSKYLFYLLKRNVEILKSNAGGTTFGELSGGRLKALKFAFPKIEEQSAIAAILSSLDDKIELNQKMNKTLEEIGQAIFKHWFVNFEFPNEEGKPYKSSGGEMVYNEELEEEVPKGWKVGYLGDKVLSNILNSGIYRFEGEKIYLDTASVQGTGIVELSTKITFEQRPSRANMQPKPSTVWFAKMKDSKKILYFDDYSEYAISNFILSTGFAGLDVKKYALYYIWSLISRDEFELEKDNLCNGTTMQAINNENITKIKLLTPPKDILEKFNIIIKPIYRKSYCNWLQNLSLSQIRDSLLPKLMSGKVRVLLEEVK